MKEITIIAKAINKETKKNEEVARGPFEIFESVKELVETLQSKDTNKERKERLLKAVNDQLTTWEQNRLRQLVTRPKSDIGLLKDGVKAGTISQEALDAFLKANGLKD